MINVRVVFRPRPITDDMRDMVDDLVRSGAMPPVAHSFGDLVMGIKNLNQQLLRAARAAQALDYTMRGLRT